MGEILISEEVAEQLGTETVDRLKAEGLVGPCWACGVELSTLAGDRASVSLLICLDVEQVVVTHATCAESRLVYTGKTAQADSSDDAVFWSAVVPSVDGARAILLFQDRFPEHFLESGDVVRPGMGAMLDLGFTPVSTLGRKPAPLQGWSAFIDYDGSGRIVDNAGREFLDTLPDDDAWRALALMSGFITVLFGDFERVMGKGFDAKALNALARNGGIVGARIRVSKESGNQDPVANAGKRLASALYLTRTKPARRPGAKPDPRAILPLASEPLLTPFTAKGVSPDDGEFGVLMIDLRDPDADRARESMRILQARGFRLGHEPSGGYLLQTAPKGWVAAVWPSQVQLWAPNAADGHDLVLFEQLAMGDQRWYSAVRSKAAVGIVIGNDMGPNAIRDLQVMIRSGEAMGMGVPAWGML